jgi:hypothetical protein
LVANGVLAIDPMPHNKAVPVKLISRIAKLRAAGIAAIARKTEALTPLVAQTARGGQG